MMNDKNTDMRTEITNLKKDNKQLKKENERQKKALAEAAILLTLKKSTNICLRRTGRTKLGIGTRGDSRFHRHSENRTCLRAYHLFFLGHHAAYHTKLAPSRESGSA